MKDINLYHSFLSERQELERLEINSICRCPACRKTTKDMIFNSILNKWFCIDCYEEIQNEYQIRKHLRRLALDTDDYDVHFYESFDKS